MKALKDYECDDCPGHSGASALDRYIDVGLWLNRILTLLKWH